ncbi:hypothetical protein [Oleidesulfovibrio sp.]|uniref:hypothetical protein n=1 Tax=Oleidesulfovibrio sp. TaxID=2909707 RepID=UPI003A8651A7
MNPDVITSYTCPLCGMPYADGEEAKECLARCRKRQAARKALAPEATAHEVLSEEIALGLERVLPQPHLM